MSEFIQLQPFDEHNAALRDNVHPADWQNPKPHSPCPLVVIGAGTAGLVTAAGAASLGARVTLVERELMGGDCLNVGCVPSKALIQSGRVLAELRDATQFGVQINGPVEFDFATAMRRMRQLRARISQADSAQRFKDLGVDVCFGQARFTGPNTLEVVSSDGRCQSIPFKKAVIATGARAATPPIDGLDQIAYLTNENVFSLTELPARLGIIGAGPIGVELAQAFARFGSEVTLFERSDHILDREDRDASTIVNHQLQQDGVMIRLKCNRQKLAPIKDGQVRITGNSQAGNYNIVVDRLLIAVGRQPNVDGLNLEAAGVRHNQKGIQVDDWMQTTNRRIFAAGDVASRYQFTHAADFMARIVIQNALFSIGPFGKRKASRLLIPWTTYTTPEVAHVGMYEHEALDRGISVNTFVQSFSENDRAIIEGSEIGFVKVHVKGGTDKIVGATIVGKNAGDLISELTLAIQNGIGLSQIGSTIHPYPTQADAIRRLGDQYNKTRLTPFSSRILKTLMRFNVG